MNHQPNRDPRQPQRRNQPPRALVGNAADEEQVANALETEELTQMSSDDHTMAVFSTKSGRAEYWRFLSFCGISHSTLNAVDMHNKIDPLAMTAAEGRRNVGLWLQATLLRLSPDLYFLMHREAVENRSNG